MKVMVLNGVNLSRLGTREPGVYGTGTHAQLAERLIGVGAGLGLAVDVRQTDSEAELIAWLHEAADEGTPVVLNPGAWTHYALALADAAREVPYLIEVHLSNVFAREEFRHHSVISPVAAGVIVGLGAAGYDLALTHLASRAG